MSDDEWLEEVQTLPHSTGECDEGPEIAMAPGVLTIRYDAEVESGRHWTALRFAGAVALRVTPDSAVLPMIARAYSRIGIVKNSKWLASLQHGRFALPPELEHFVVYFDHYGSIEAIARSCEVCEV